MNLRWQILLGAARSRLPLEMAEKITVGTVFSSVKDDLFSSFAKARARQTPQDSQSRAVHLKKIEGILASVSMPFNMLIQDNDLKQLFMCLHELQISFHESEFCLLFSEWLAAQILRCDLKHTLFLLRCINSVSVISEEGLNTFTLKHIGIPTIIKLMEECQTVDFATALIVFLQQSLRAPDSTITAEMFRDVERIKVNLVHRMFQHHEKEDADICAQNFQNLLDISRVVKAGSSVGNAIETKIGHLFTNATLKQLIKCVLVFHTRTHSAAYESVVSNEFFSPHGSSEFEKILCESSTSSIVFRLVDAKEIRAALSWKDLDSVLTLVGEMKNISPEDMTLILKSLQNSIKNILKKEQINNIATTFAKFAACAERADHFSSIKGHVLALTNHIYSRLVNSKFEDMQVSVLLDTALGVVHLLAIDSGLDATLEAFCLYFIKNRKYLNSEIAVCVVKMLSLMKTRHSMLIQLMKVECDGSALGSFEQSIGDSLLAHITSGKSGSIVSALASLQKWYRPMNDDFLMIASKAISKGSIQKVEVSDAILCLQVLCEQRHIIHVQSIVHIANHLLNKIEDLKQSDIIQILFHLLNGKVKYDKLTDRLYLRMTEINLNSVESVQLLFFLDESKNRKESLVKRFMSIALEDILFFPMVRTIVADLELQVNDIWENFFACVASKFLCMKFNIPDSILCGNLLHTVTNLPRQILEKFIKDTLVPLTHRVLEEACKKDNLFVLAALLLKCKQILPVENFNEMISESMYEEVLRLAAEKAPCIDSEHRTEETPLQDLFLTDAQVDHYKQEIFRKVLHLESIQTLSYSSLRIRDASLIFIIFGGSVSPSIVLLPLEKKNICLDHMKLLVPVLTKGFESISKQHRIDILFTLAYHRWRTCRLLPFLLRSFVHVGNDESLTTLLIFQYASKMLGIVDNAFLTMTRKLLTEQYVVRRKSHPNSIQVSPFEKFVQNIR